MWSEVPADFLPLTKEKEKGLFRTFEDFEFRAGFFCLLWSVPA
jgi:hypothetical protein